jgi:hypothetical protein
MDFIEREKKRKELPFLAWFGYDNEHETEITAEN